MGVSIDKWGPCAWNTLHAFAHTMPRVLDTPRRAELRQFLYSFATFLPCPRCRRHFVAYLDAHLDRSSLATRENVVVFLHEAHNDVNVRLGKRAFTLEEHLRIYARPTAARRSVPLMVVVGSVVAVGAYFVMRRREKKSPS